MNSIEEVLSYKKTNGTHCWIFDTTRSNLIGFERSEELGKEIDDWEKHRPFAEQYGLIMNNPEDYISIYIISNLLLDFELLCHPDEQEEGSSLDNLNLNFELVRWLYLEEIHYDNEYNYNIVLKGFDSSVYSIKEDNRSMLKVTYDMITNRKPKSRIYDLLSPLEVHQAVICGGNVDVFNRRNYYGVSSDSERIKLIELLGERREPSLDEILNHCQFFILDFKGEDIGYARQLKIYSKNNIQGKIDLLVSKFRKFQSSLKEIRLRSKNLREYEIESNKLIEALGN